MKAWAALAAAVCLTGVGVAKAEELTLNSSPPKYLQADGSDKAAVSAAGAEAAKEQQAYDPNTGRITLTGGVDFTTAYFFRGYNQEDTGLITQPWATITANVCSSDKHAVNVYVGSWNSLHEKQTLSAATGPSAWYESDFYAGVDYIMGKFAIGAVYTVYQYPNGAFESIQEPGVKFGYDDTETMKGMNVPFALKPYVGVYHEFDDGNGTEDTYMELGVNPSFAIGKLGGNDVTLSIPVTLGMSLNDFYLDSDGDNALFGYGAIGAFASIPLPLGEKYGAWTLTGGVQYLYLFADSAQAVNDGGEDYELLGKVGISFAY